MKNNNFHINFKLNGNCFSESKEIILFAESLSKELHHFLIEWFSDDDFVFVKTSGSTGNPKTIRLKKEFMINSALATGSYFQLPENTTALCCLPLNFIAGKMMLVRSLILGWDLDMVDPSSNPLQIVTKEYDFSAMVPLQLSNSISKIEQLNTLIVGGGVVSQDLEKALQSISTNCYATYGMTETITHVAIRKLNKFSQLESKSVYKTLSDVTVSKDDRKCLVISAPKVSDETIITNDVVEIISKNEFIWKGRFDNVINSGGIKLYPEEIEKKLSSKLPVRFFVTSINDDELGEKLILLVESEEFITDKSVFSDLSKFEIPKQTFYIAKFIETKTGKVQRTETLKKVLSSS